MHSLRRLHYPHSDRRDQQRSRFDSCNVSGRNREITRDVMTKDRLQWIISGLDWEQLTEWEERFVENVEKFFEKSGYLSVNQEDILERIYREKGQ